METQGREGPSLLVPEEEKYIARDLSWLSFNYRVLLEAADRELPLYERIKFLAIYSSNLDEFYRVRVAGLQSIFRYKKKKKQNHEKVTDLLTRIQEEVYRQQEEFGRIFREEIIPSMQENGIHLLREQPLDPVQQTFIRTFFKEEIIPYVHPEILMKGKVAHFLRDRALYLAIRMTRKDKERISGTEPTSTKRNVYAIVLVPTHYFPRFIDIPSTDGTHTIAFLDDIVGNNLDLVFPGFVIEECYSVKLSRNAELEIEDEFEGDLVKKVADSLSRRKIGAPARFLHDKEMPGKMLKYIRKTFQISKMETVTGARYHNFMDFFQFPNPLAPKLALGTPQPLHHPQLSADTGMEKAIDAGDCLLHTPYQDFGYVVRLFQEAAFDPAVTEIKTTQYRVASDSEIVNALIQAARNGIRVTVFVEIKARFDEELNLRLAARMKKAGVSVIYSMPGLKVHAKVALIVRGKGNDRRLQAYFSTGNFNEKTARIYADHGFFTSDQRLTTELERVFYHLEHKERHPESFQHLLVGQHNMKEQFLSKIDREISIARNGGDGYMLLKMNGLEDREMIEKLYEASNSGVRIQLIVRGICCLRPGLEGLSENIRAIRIVDHYLEHARVFLFANDGQEEIYLGSADWMSRNLNRRIEVAFPVYDHSLRNEIRKILHLQLNDNRKAADLDCDLVNHLRHTDREREIRSQMETYGYLKNKWMSRDGDPPKENGMEEGMAEGFYSL